MTPRSLLFVAAASLGMITIGGNAKAADPPNVIFILCDDLGWGDLGVFHQNSKTTGKRHATPNLDKMAAAGGQLRNHYCPAPVCAPSRASLLTGVHQGHAVVRDNQFDKALEDNHTLGTVMQSAGYRTALIGKYGLQGSGNSADQWPAYPTKRGFDEFFGYVRHVDGHVHYPADRWPLGNGDKHKSPKELWHNDQEISSDLGKCYTTDLFTAKAKHWITQHRHKKADQPFFMYLAFDTPHAALQVPTMAYPSGGGLDGGLQWLGKPGRMINTADGQIDSFYHPDYANQPWTNVEKRFATMVRRIDSCVGDLIQTLDDLEIADETLIVLTSDNGPHKESYINRVEYAPTSFASYGPFDGIKRDVWEGGIRMPTLVHAPGIVPAGMIDESPSQFHDWMATMADLAGIAPPARCDGVSLLPRWSGSEYEPSKIYVEYFQNGRTPRYADFPKWKRDQKRRQMQVVHVDGFKGVRFDIQSHNDPFMVFDLRVDPTETKDLAGSDDSFRVIQQRLHDQVLRMRRPNASAKRPYDGEPVPALKPDERDADSSPFQLSFFAGDFLAVPQTSSLQPTMTTSVASLGQFPGDADISDKGALLWSGTVEIEETGLYEVEFSSSVRAFVRLHEIALIDGDFGYQPGQTITQSIRLEKGSHPVKLTCLVDKPAATSQDPQLELTFSLQSK